MIIKKVLPKTDSRVKIKTYKNYLLHFYRNVYVNFIGEKENGYIKVHKILSRVEDSHKEKTDMHINFNQQIKFQKKINENCIIEVNEKFIKIYKNNKINTYQKKDVSDGCLIKFM